MHGILPLSLCGLVRTLIIGFIQHDLILTRLHLQRPFFQIRSPSLVPGVRTSTHVFMRHNSTHNRGFDLGLITSLLGLDVFKDEIGPIEIKLENRSLWAMNAVVMKNFFLV